ncbi:MAG: aminotransferase class I/II-fold pyridoxal phosphate-dependent enzyme [SAR324 cluster bacterium]|nr:aminotransferase class I/II-fold pyridoxal phosphate-dependent enzyme [SAR324 cluster bacterium]
MALFAERNQRIGSENAFKVGPHIVRVGQSRGPVVKLNLGEPDYDLPKAVNAEIKRQLDAGNTHYCDPQGTPNLRSAISEYVNRTRGLNTTPGHVVVFPGGKPSIGLTQQIYCNPGDEVIYPSPGFPIYESFISYVQAVPVPLHLDESAGFTFTTEQLAELITSRTKVIYLNFPSNPTGGVASQSQIEEIADVILRKAPPDARVYSDEIYERIVFDGQQHYSILQVPGMAERTILASGFSKTFAWTGGRIGYAVLPTVTEVEMFKTLNINYFSCVAPYNQEAAVVALTDETVEQEVLEMVRTFEERRDAVLEDLRAIPGVECQKPGGAFYLFPNIEGVCKSLGLIDYHSHLNDVAKKETSPAGLFQMFALYDHQVAVLDRLSFGRIGADGKHFLRLSTASQLGVLRDGVQRLRDAAQDQAGLEQFLKERPDLNQ